MKLLDRRAAKVIRQPGRFALQTLKAFKANQGLLLAGAVAYYALLSIVPLLILIVIALSHVVDQVELVGTIGLYLEWLIPGQSASVVGELSAFLEHRDVMGWVLFATMIFFSSLAFTVLENAMSVVFLHRVKVHRRHFLVSAILPYLYILALGVGLLAVTFVAGSLQAMGDRSVHFLGRAWSLDNFSVVLLYLLGVGGEIFILTSIYLVMPVGPPRVRHALVGAVTATLLWEITRHVLLWYFGTLSQVSAVYGSFTAAIVILLSLEIGAILLLFGAQVIAEYERLGHEPIEVPPEPLRTAAPPPTGS